MKKLVLFFLLLFGLPGASAFAASSDTTPEIEQKIRTLLEQMTLEEKLGQLQQLDGPSEGTYRPEHVDMVRKGLLGSTLNVRGAKITNELQRVAMTESRLKIPMLFAYDVIHGYRTIFPMPLAETSTWNTELAKTSAQMAAAEASSAGIKWTFAPMVDIARDARWGRIVEGSGEDPYLSSVFATARVQGFQGEKIGDHLDLSAPDKIMACAKHWVGYGAAEGGRDYNSTEISEHTLREMYFPPFKAAVDAGVGTFMTAFNDLNGVPATANPFILNDVLKGEWNFSGFVVSDYESVKELIKHGLAANGAEAAQYAIEAGLDMEMVSTLFMNNMPFLLAQKKVETATIDNAVARILRMKFRLGLFDNPYVDESREAKTIGKIEFKKAARDIAAQSMVLLKNEKSLLPLRKDLKSLAVIGPLADDSQAPLGSWHADAIANSAVSALSGIKNKLPNTTIHFAKGCDIEGGTKSDIEAAVTAAQKSEVAIVVLGESAEMSGEAASRSNLDLPGHQLELLQAVMATGTPVVVVLMNGRPLTINWVAQNAPAILEAWFGGSEAGNAIADVLFGDVNPSGKLPVTFPRAVGQIPIYYNHKNTGRPPDLNNKYSSKYIDLESTPLYPFGYGLSYTKFSLSNLQLDKKILRPGEKLQVLVNITNTGAVAGTEVVQLYLRDVAASVTRPVKELKGFARVEVQPGETKQVALFLKHEELGFYDRRMNYIVEPGTFEITIGTDSASGITEAFNVP